MIVAASIFRTACNLNDLTNVTLKVYVINQQRNKLMSKDHKYLKWNSTQSDKGILNCVCWIFCNIELCILKYNGNALLILCGSILIFADAYDFRDLAVFYSGDFGRFMRNFHYMENYGHPLKTLKAEDDVVE